MKCMKRTLSERICRAIGIKGIYLGNEYYYRFTYIMSNLAYYKYDVSFEIPEIKSYISQEAREKDATSKT